MGEEKDARLSILPMHVLELPVYVVEPSRVIRQQDPDSSNRRRIASDGALLAEAYAA